MQVNVYMGTQLVAVLDAAPRVAWPAAVAYVRAMAHADGVEGGMGLEAPAGRASYARGLYRAVTAARVRQ